MSNWTAHGEPDWSALPVSVTSLRGLATEGFQGRNPESVKPPEALGTCSTVSVFFCFLLLVSFLFSFSTFDKGNLTDLSEEFSNNSLDVSQSQEKTAVDLFTGLQSRQPVSNQTGASVFLDGGGFNRSSGYLSSRLTGAYERSLHLCIIDLIILLRRNSCVSYGAS